MAKLVSALDAHTGTQLGENGHTEYSWSNETKEKILQLSFQLTRTSDPVQLAKLRTIYQDLVEKVFYAKSSEDVSEDQLAEWRGALTAMPLHTRDIVAGKGEYNLFYHLVGGFSLAVEAHRSSAPAARTRWMEGVLIDMTLSAVHLEGHDHAYGSWKDVKYLLNHLRTIYGEELLSANYLFKAIVTAAMDQLRLDAREGATDKTLIARWLPREKSKKFGWQAKHFATEYFSEWASTGGTSARRKCLTHYRQLLGRLNVDLKTPQVNQCARAYSSIDFNSDVTSVTMSRQKHAFQFVDKHGDSRTTYDEGSAEWSDRMKCRENYLSYLDSCRSGETSIKAARVGIVDMVREGCSYKGMACNEAAQALIDALNMQWKESGKNMGALKNFVACVDTSGSMECEQRQPLYAAVGLGLRIAEHSTLGPRVMTFNTTPTWINLEGKEEFVDKVQFVRYNDQWGGNTNFQKAFRLILDKCVEQDLAPEEVSELVFVMLSDMEIDQADKDTSSIHALVTSMCADAGMRTSHKRPYTPFHMVYWNLRSTGGFPSLSSHKNVSMLSGFSPMLLNSFCTKGIEALKDADPWVMLLDQLHNPRYAWAWTRTETWDRVETHAVPSEAEEKPRSWWLWS